MPRFEINEARAEDSAELRELFRLPMEGSIAIAAEREPDYFLSAAVQNETPRIFVGRDRDRGRLAGVFSVGERRVYVNGSVQTVPYFCDLRVYPEYRRGTLLARGYRFVRERVLDGPAFAQTIVVADNKIALDALTSGRGGLPRYFPAGEYHTHAISLKNRAAKQNRFHVRPARLEDRTEMQAFFDREAPHKQFYPVYDFSLLNESPYYRDIKLEDFWLALEEKKIVGLLGVWDQKNFKQTRVTSYSAGLASVRPLYNLFTRLGGGIPLPPAGSTLAYFQLYSILIRDNRPDIFGALVDALLDRYRDSTYDYFLCGLDGKDPLNAVLQSKRGRIFRGRHFLISFGEDPRSNLDPRIFYLETGRI